MQHKYHPSISTTELVRNLSTIIDEVRISKHSLYITKGSQMVAKLSPPPKPGCSAIELIELLKTLPTLKDEAQSMAKDLELIKKQATLPEDLWD